ncbi:hypothetical protein ACI7RC_08000 [Brevibacillus sp. B_LB10_24]|uniref:hypothetical protein n=1 Tax=Brevibacillus sp. B_LB10_24 TaxID=3380645 RepID=UPI0038BDE49E
MISFQDETVAELLLLGLLHHQPQSRPALKDKMAGLIGPQSAAQLDEGIARLKQRCLILEQDELSINDRGLEVLAEQIRQHPTDPCSLAIGLLLPVKMLFLPSLGLAEQKTMLERWAVELQAEKARVQMIMEKLDRQGEDSFFYLWHEHSLMVLISRIEWLKMVVRRWNNRNLC